MSRDLIERDAEAQILYTAFGKFAIHFERMVAEMRRVIDAVLDRQGLQNTAVKALLTAKLTAEPLRDLILCLVGETERLSKGDEKAFQDVMSRVQKLTAERNDVIHAMWFARDAERDSAEVIGWRVKYKNSKKGSSIAPPRLYHDDFNALTKEAIELSRCLMVIGACIAFRHQIKKNFEFDENGKAVPLPIFNSELPENLLTGKRRVAG